MATYIQQFYTNGNHDDAVELDCTSAEADDEASAEDSAPAHDTAVHSYRAVQGDDLLQVDGPGGAATGGGIAATGSGGAFTATATPGSAAVVVASEPAVGHHAPHADAGAGMGPETQVTPRAAMGVTMLAAASVSHGEGAARAPSAATPPLRLSDEQAEDGHDDDKDEEKEDSEEALAGKLALWNRFRRRPKSR